MCFLWATLRVVHIKHIVLNAVDSMDNSASYPHNPQRLKLRASRCYSFLERETEKSLRETRGEEVSSEVEISGLRLYIKSL